MPSMTPLGVLVENDVKFYDDSMAVLIENDVKFYDNLSGVLVTNDDKTNTKTAMESS